MQPADFDEALGKILDRDKRYHRDAYLFLREALDHAQKKFQKSKDHPVRHVSGPELLEGIREYALAVYGPMSRTVLNEWGVQACEDFGELVFNMVDQGLLSKTEEDSREDFKGLYTFQDAFVEPFLPANRRERPAAPKAAEPSK